MHVYKIEHPAPPVPEECGGRLWERSGTIQSPGFPNNSPKNKECTWVIYATNSQPISLQFSQFNIESNDRCDYDYLEVRNGGSPISPLIGKFCDHNKAYNLSSSNDALFLRFVSHSSGSRAGFNLHFDSDRSCYKNMGWYYNGTMMTTSSGTMCQRWDSTTPHKPGSKYTNLQNFPDHVTSLAGVNNYCRNPGGSTQPWCYTSDPHTEWDYCGVRKC